MRRHATLGFAAAIAAAPLAAQWGPVTTPATPAERQGALLAFDVPGNRALMFGGNGTNELWSLQNGTWTQLQPAVSPGPRSRTAIATDTLAGTVLLYGGYDGGRYANDETWQWDGVSWSPVASVLTPGGLGKHAMAFDHARQSTVLFGGLRDTWAPYQVSALTWQFANGQWTQATPVQSPPARVRAAMSYHPALTGVLLFGGEDGAGVPFGDTWFFDGLTWAPAGGAGVQPSPRAGAGLLPVLSRSSCVLFGGRDPVSMVIANDTWEHDGNGWMQVQGVYAGVYPPRAEFGICHDLVRDRLVLFGGVIANNSLQNDTWEYGASWSRFGLGCSGTAGVPSLDGGALPRFGATSTAQLTNLPPASGAAFVAVGLSRTQWAFGSLPALLTGFGMPGCRAYVSADALTAVGAAAGVANWSWTVPSWPGFLGQTFHLQGIALDPAANAAGLTVSNALTMVVGI